MEPLMVHFPPGRGGGEGVAYGYKGKGITIHSVIDSCGMPLHTTVTAANGDERKQVMPLLDGIIVERKKRGRPRKRLKKIACDKGYDDQKLRNALRKRGIKPEIPKRQWKGKKQRGRPMVKTIPRYKVERTFSWFSFAALRVKENIEE
jgi:IS5 family transposase